MSADEGIALIVSLITGPVMWAVWGIRLSALQSLRPKRAPLAVLMGTLALCSVLLGGVLVTMSAPDVREDTAYLALYFMMGLAWLRMGEATFAFAGISARDDVLERRNDAAIPAVVGALVGVTCCFAGGNIGAGPGWWVVLFSAGIATATWLGLWLAVDRYTLAVDAITIDRDAAAALRLGGWLIATGLVLGRAVAGDWHSAVSTLRDFVRLGWIVVPLTAVAGGVERYLRPASRPRAVSMAAGGVMPALVYAGIAVAYVAFLGSPA